MQIEHRLLALLGDLAQEADQIAMFRGSGAIQFRDPEPCPLLRLRHFALRHQQGDLKMRKRNGIGVFALGIAEIPPGAGEVAGVGADGCQALQRSRADRAITAFQCALDQLLLPARLAQQLIGVDQQVEQEFMARGNLDSPGKPGLQQRERIGWLAAFEHAVRCIRDGFWIHRAARQQRPLFARQAGEHVRQKIETGKCLGMIHQTTALLELPAGAAEAGFVAARAVEFAGGEPQFGPGSAVADLARQHAEHGVGAFEVICLCRHLRQESKARVAGALMDFRQRRLPDDDWTIDWTNNSKP